MSYVLLYTLETREMFILEAIKREILKMDKSAAVFILPFYDIVGFGLKQKIDVVLSPPIADDCSAMVMTMVKLQHKCKVVCLTTEGLDYYYEDEDACDHRVGLWEFSEKLIDYYFFWGEKPAQILGPRLLSNRNLSSQKRIGVSGYVQYDKSVEKYYKIEKKFEEKYNSFKQEYKKIYLFLTGFGFTNKPIEEARIYGILNDENETVTEEEILERYDTKINYAKQYLQMINEISGDSSSGIIVKLHPNEIDYINPELELLYNQLQNRNNILYIDFMLPVAFLLSDVNLVVHYGSTVGLESYIYKVPTIYAHTEKNYVEEIYPSTYTVDLNSISCFLNSGKKIQFKENEKVEQILKDLFNYTDNQEYHPAGVIAHELVDGIDKQYINKQDPIVKKVLRYKRPQCYKEYYLVDVLLQVKHLKAKELKNSINNLMRIEPNIFWCISDYFSWIKGKVFH